MEVYILFIILIVIASALLVLAVLAQSPKGGMAANFGASNQVLGVRQTADRLEKFTWGFAVAIVVFSLAATMAMPNDKINQSNQMLENEILQKGQQDSKMQPLELPVGTQQTESAPATEGNANAQENETQE